MNDLKKFGNKLLTSVLTGLTAFSMSFGAFLPAAVHAACPEVEAGDLVKVPNNSAVYLINADMKRMYFPNAEVYFSWYTDFDGVIELDPASCIDAYPSAGGVNYRAGARLIKTDVSPSVFAVGPNNMKHKLSDPAVAASLYGSNWEKLVRVIPDVFDANYDLGSELTEAKPHDGQLVKTSGDTAVYYVWNGMLKKVDGDLGKATSGDVRTVSQAVFDSLDMAAASDTVTPAALTANPSQKTAGSSDGGSTDGGSAAAGELTVSLAADTPAPGNIALGANANVMAFNVSAGADPVKISKLTIKQSGLADTNDFENLKILGDDGVLLGSTVAALNSSEEAKFNFSTPITVAANSTKKLWLRVGVNSTNGTSGNLAKFEIPSASAFTLSGSGTVKGTFPIVGSQFNLVATTIGTLAAGSDGTTPDTTPDVDDVDVVVNKFKLQAGSEEDIVIEGMTFLESGTASVSDTTNLELWNTTDNKKIGEASWNSEGKAHFSGLNITIPKGKTIRFALKLDIIDGSGLTVNADLVDGSDVLVSAKGAKHGFYLTSSLLSSWNGKGSSDQTINAGSVTVSMSTESPDTGNIAAGDDQLLAVFNFDVKGEPVLITSLEVNGDLGSMLFSEVTNAVVKDKDGNILAGPVDATSDSGAKMLFSDNFTLETGQNDLYIYATISSDVSSGDTIQTDIDAAADITVKGFRTNTTITPTVNAAANTLTVRAATLEATTLTTPAARNVAVGAKDIVWMHGALRAQNSGEDIIMQTIQLTNTVAGDSAVTDIVNAEIWADLTSENSVRGDVFETKVTDTENPTAAATTFTLTNQFTIKKNQEVRVALVADVLTTATGDGGDTMTWDFSDADGVGASTGAAAGATPTGAGQAFTITTAGALTIATNSTYPSTTPMLAYTEQKGVTVAEFKLTADDVEDIEVDKLSIEDLGTANGVVIDTLYFYVGSSLVGSVSAGATTTLFLPDGKLKVPADTDVVLTVKADFPKVDGSTVANGNFTQLRFPAGLTTPNTASVGVSSTGLSGGSTINNSASVLGPSTTLFEAYPKIALKTDSNGNPLPLSGDLSIGSNIVVMRILVTSVGAKDITFETGDTNQIQVTMATTLSDTSSSNSTISKTFTLKDVTSGLNLSTVAHYVSGTDTSARDIAFIFEDNNLTVPKGETRELQVIMDTTEFEDGGDSVQMTLNDNVTSTLWGIDGSGSNAFGDIILRGDLIGPAFTKKT